MIVGLGNPGREYDSTRHNVGFAVIAELCRRHGASKPKLRFEAEIAEATISNEKCLLVCPQTYMNLSGRSVRQLIDFYQTPLADLIVVSDDMNLDVGKLRLRPGGSAGGQNGLSDVLRHLGTEDFARLRIGIGRPPGKMSSTDWVLGRFRSEEKQEMEHATIAAA
ncbi:MAG: aminoacyl-tRNA hydrolase, partial [Planctomycetaceae bacterium]